MNLDSVVGTFIAESAEMLDSMEESLLLLEDDPRNDELISAVFRAAHTIKGSAGIFGFDEIVRFTHQVESLLDKIRDGDIAIDGPCIALLLQCNDHMRDIVTPVTAGDPIDEITAARGEKLIGELCVKMGAPGVATEADTSASPASSNADEGEGPGTAPDSDQGGSTVTDNWHISLRFGQDVLRMGMDPLSFLRYLSGMGEITHVITLLDSVPLSDEMDPESCYIGLEISFNGNASKSEIEQVFEFVRDDCQIRIIPPHSKIAEFIDYIETMPEDAARIGELLVQAGALTQHELEKCLELQVERSQQMAASDDALPEPLGKILIDNGAASSQVVKAALDKQLKDRDRKSHESQLIRIDAEKLDQLINLVGELVIGCASTRLHADRTGNPALIESTTNVTHLVEEVRNNALSLRMVQIGPTFQRFKRVVRDVSQELGKEIELVIRGGDTELDKSVVEKIADPLMHLVRNAMDHGIEPPPEREASGKPVKARVTLNAYHDSGSIVIEVSDDGAGLKREKILAKAIDRGLISSGQELTDREVFSLIFEAGFSTAEAVSNLSGRGVGMDVVRRNIESLRGTIELDSKEGSGTTVRVRLPLTLAIIDGFLVGIGSAHYVIPLDMIVECMEFAELDCQLAAEKGFINLRGEVLPTVRLCELFGLPDTSSQRENIVVVKWGAQKAGLVVDELLGELQTVIKPLGKLFSHISGISGSTILGSGEVALILDVTALIQDIEARDRLARTSREMTPQPEDPQYDTQGEGA